MRYVTTYNYTGVKVDIYQQGDNYWVDFNQIRVIFTGLLLSQADEMKQMNCRVDRSKLGETGVEHRILLSQSNIRLLCERFSFDLYMIAYVQMLFKHIDRLEIATGEKKNDSAVTEKVTPVISNQVTPNVTNSATPDCNSVVNRCYNADKITMEIAEMERSKREYSEKYAIEMKIRQYEIDIKQSELAIAKLIS